MGHVVRGSAYVLAAMNSSRSYGHSVCMFVCNQIGFLEMVFSRSTRHVDLGPVGTLDKLWNPPTLLYWSVNRDSDAWAERGNRIMCRIY